MLGLVIICFYVQLNFLDLCRLSQMHIGLKNTAENMIGCIRKEKRKRLNVKDAAAVLKLK